MADINFGDSQGVPFNASFAADPMIVEIRFSDWTTGIDQAIANHNQSPLAHPELQELLNRATQWIPTTASIQAAVNRNYLLSSLSLISVGLPEIPEVNDSVGVYGLQAASWRLVPAAGHRIRVGDLVTTAGGSVSSRAVGDGITLSYAGSELWFATQVLGNLEII